MAQQKGLPPWYFDSRVKWARTGAFRPAALRVKITAWLRRLERLRSQLEDADLEVMYGN